MNKISYRRHRFPAEIIQRAAGYISAFPSAIETSRICWLNAALMCRTKPFGVGC